MSNPGNACAAYLIPAALLAAGCYVYTTPRPNCPPPPVRPDTTRTAPSPARDSAIAELQQRLDRLELRLLERDAQVEDLQARLDTARQEVVGAMAKVQSLATRAEAASGMAEAEVALQSLRTAAGQQALSEIDLGARLLGLGSAEFDKGNYGGALYLANQAKSAAAMGRGRLAASSERAPLRTGEVPFALPVPLQAASHGNVREGPGTNYDIIFTVEPGAALTGYSYVEDWVRVADATGRSGWVFRNLLTRRSGGGP